MPGRNDRMSQASTEIDVLDPQRDKPAVFAWLRSFLRWHLDVWSKAAGRYWNEAAIDRHIDENGLVDREWEELTGAVSDAAQLVAVARASGRAVGIIHCQERTDRYLRMPVGVVAWLFVEPVSRGTGVSALLLDEGRAWMHSRELDVGEVFVTADNLAAVTVYRRAGYEIIDYRMMSRLE